MRSIRASLVDIQGVLCAILTPMPRVNFASLNIFYHSYLLLYVFSTLISSFGSAITLLHFLRVSVLSSLSLRRYLLGSCRFDEHH